MVQRDVLKIMTLVQDFSVLGLGFMHISLLVTEVSCIVSKALFDHSNLYLIRVLTTEKMFPKMSAN